MLIDNQRQANNIQFIQGEKTRRVIFCPVSASQEGSKPYNIMENASIDKQKI